MAKGSINYTPSKKWQSLIQGIKNFGRVKVGNTTITPISNEDTIELASGTNITLNTDSNNKKVIINGASAVKNPAALTVQLNGTSQGAYDGSSAKTVNITPTNIGAATSGHTHTSASIGAAATNHTHSKSQITDFPATLKNPASLTLQLNGTSQEAYDGSSAKTVNITPGNIGAAASNHTHSNYSTATNIKNGSGNDSVQERNAEATGSYAHAEGYSTRAIGDYSHSEGLGTKATGRYSHAEGESTLASGLASHACGKDTIADNYYMTAMGRYNRPNSDANANFVIGFGTADNNRANSFRVDYMGRVYAALGYNTGGADYAEFFEWRDGNTESEDRIGYFVALDGNKIKIASKGDYILGVVSGTASIIGNSCEDWIGRYLKDNFGRIQYHEIEEIIELEDGTYKSYKRICPIQNPNYDATKKYMERKERKEWSVVGMLGQVIVRDDNTCQVNSYCTIANGGIATASEDKTGYRVIERIADNIIKIIFR